MSSDDTQDRSRIDQGKEAYGQLHLDEASAYFEKAVAADPQSVEALLCYGVICLFQYQNGITPEQIAEQNATNGKRAEEGLRRALDLEPRNILVMEYLAYLYRVWLDMGSWGDTRLSRLADAQHWYKQILETYPEHEFANYVCGVIGWQRAFELIQSSGYPYPLPSEAARLSLHSRVTPLLAEAAVNLLRSVELDPDDWHRKAVRILQSQAKLAGETWPSQTGTVTFTLIPESLQSAGKIARLLFPPDPRMIVPLGLTPPPPPPRISR